MMLYLWFYAIKNLFLCHFTPIKAFSLESKMLPEVLEYVTLGD